MKPRLTFRILGTLLLFYGAGLVVARVLETFIAQEQERQLRVDYIERNGLPLTAKHLFLSRGMTQAYEPRFPEGPDPEAFLAGVPADAFPKDRPLRLSIYISESIAGAMEVGSPTLVAEAAAKGVDLKWLSSAEELRRALLEDDVIFWSGHSNFGQGFLFEDEVWVVEGAHRFQPQKEFDPLAPDLPRKPFPECRAPVVVVWGCRSDTYYGDALSVHAPETAWLTTTFAFAPSPHFPVSLELLIHTLSVRASLQDWVEEVELLYREQHLRGRVSELKFYGRMPDPQATLFLIRPPAKNLPED